MTGWSGCPGFMPLTDAGVLHGRRVERMTTVDVICCVRCPGFLRGHRGEAMPKGGATSGQAARATFCCRSRTHSPASSRVFGQSCIRRITAGRGLRLVPEVRRAPAAEIATLGPLYGHQHGFSRQPQTSGAFASRLHLLDSSGFCYGPHIFIETQNTEYPHFLPFQVHFMHAGTYKIPSPCTSAP